MSSTAAASLVVEALSHRYPGSDRLALDGVSLAVEPGARLGLLGPNGAGKSTLMRIVCGFLPVQADPSGRAVKVEVAALDVRTRSLQVREQVGYMPEQVPLYHELRAVEHLRFRARIKGVPRRGRAGEVARVAELVGIRDVLDMPVGKLSRGYRQRVGLADALLGSPPLLVLDEPTVGLDPNQVRDVRAMLRELGGKQTLLFSSHILAEVEQLCDRVVILAGGRAVVDESLREATAARTIVVACDGEVEPLRAAVAVAWNEVGGAGECAMTADGAGRVRVEVGRDVDVDALLPAIGKSCARRGVTLSLLQPGRTLLEERFAAVTGARGGDA
jgi:ABC-2 type transport system ATP-binding protein